MASPPQPRAAGAFIAFALLAGVVVGALYGEPSLGLLVGLGVGVMVALATWLAGRTR